MVAHQYLVREKKALEEKNSIDFELSDVSLKKSKILLINKSTATKLIVEYEWLGTMPYIIKYCFGLYFDINGIDVLGGVITFGDDYAENTGVWKKYGFEDKLLLLNRGVCLWWTPKNSASYFISRACKWLKENTKYRIITATVDPLAGEIGTIYQSLNWKYFGLMSGNYYHNKETKRFSVLINGKLRYSRWIRNDVGSMKKELILEKYPDAKFIPQYRKRRYFYFNDTKAKNKQHIKALRHLIQPYPKRNVEIIGIIYLIKNKVNKKVYVGQTVRSFSERIQNYKNGQGNDYINNSINKYGWDNFEFSIIDNAETIQELNEKEIKYIKQYNSNNKEFGYNIEIGGRNSIPDITTLEKMSRSHLGIVQNQNWVNKRIAKSGSDDAKKYGKRKTEEERLQLSVKSPKYWLGKSRDVETKQKISKTKKEKGFSEKQKEVLCKRVFKKNTLTNIIINTYDSTAIASINEKVNQSTISRWCKNHKIINNILWSY